jgi:hypothetical protein
MLNIGPRIYIEKRRVNLVYSFDKETELRAEQQTSPNWLPDGR